MRTTWPVRNSRWGKRSTYGEGMARSPTRDRRGEIPDRLSLLLSRHRQRKTESRALAQRALDLDPAAVRFDQTLDDVQPQPQSVSSPLARRRMVESLEEVGSGFRGDARSTVDDARDHLGGSGLEGDQHLAPA